MSTHKCEVVPVALEKHPNADTLSVARVFGYTVCVRTQDWLGNDKGVYIPPDSVVPATEQFAFLGDHRRIKVKKLRGIISQGLLMPAPQHCQIGDDLMVDWGITHYEPPVPAGTGGDNEPGPSGFYPKYDVESFNRYGHLLKEGEPVVITEKIHGCNSRFVFAEDRMWCGSRTNWKKQDDKCLWWKALKQNPVIEQWCREHPGLVLYGEVYGQVQDLKYGTRSGEYRFAGFDILDHDQWLSWTALTYHRGMLPWVPVVFTGAFSEAHARDIAELDSLVPGANHMREGVVIKPLFERTDPEVGRVFLKIVSNRYLES